MYNMPEFEGGYKCYLSKKSAANNCQVPTPAGKNVTYYNSNNYINRLYCTKSCSNN